MLAVLYPEDGELADWWLRFLIMMGLSIVIAVMGLSLNSIAVVIGAMLIAPLMTPVLGISASLVMAWPKRFAQSGFAVLLGSAGGVGLAWALTLLLPQAGQILTPEVLSRTSPDLRDLAVALAAGAAGAYATSRPDVSAALPGVAVAVALVPPLAAAGFTLAIGRQDLTGGALLLFGVNLVSIVFVAALIFLARGFVPWGRYRVVKRRVKVALVATLVLVGILAVPLTTASLRNASNAQTTQSVNQAIVEWMAPYPSLKLLGVEINGKDVTIDLSGPTSPPSNKSLNKVLTGLMGPGVASRVRWFQTAN